MKTKKSTKIVLEIEMVNNEVKSVKKNNREIKMQNSSFYPGSEFTWPLKVTDEYFLALIERY